MKLVICGNNYCAVGYLIQGNKNGRSFERREVQRIFAAADPLMQRVYNQGYGLIR
jgi:hypothetical protein